MAAAQDAGADMVVTQGAVQSNHVRQTAAAAAKLGMKCHAVLEGRVPDVASSYETTGNVLFDHMFGATMEFRPSGLDMNAEAQAVTDSLRAAGNVSISSPAADRTRSGRWGMYQCAGNPAADRGPDLDPKWIVVATGDAGTQAGLVAGSMPMIAISRLWASA